MNGYTMEDAEKIIGAAPVRVCGQCPSDPDYPALLEIYRRYIRGDHPMLLASSAFSLGHAIGVRDELARRSRARVDPRTSKPQGGPSRRWSGHPGSARSGVL